MRLQEKIMTSSEWSKTWTCTRSVLCSSRYMDGTLISRGVCLCAEIYRFFKKWELAVMFTGLKKTTCFEKARVWVWDLIFKKTWKLRFSEILGDHSRSSDVVKCWALKYPLVHCDQNNPHVSPWKWFGTRSGLKNRVLVYIFNSKLSGRWLQFLFFWGLRQNWTKMDR